MSLILVDQDGVIADWGATYGRMLDRYGKAAQNIPRHENQRSFNLNEGLNEDEKNIVSLVMEHMDYSGLDPIPGAIEALHGMLEYGHDVMICTSPWLPNAHCVPGKLDWVRYHLGAEWEERVIVTKDKTMVMGDVLVDDKPNITGRLVPTWAQYVFDQPYNRELPVRERLKSWDEWNNEYIERIYG